MAEVGFPQVQLAPVPRFATPDFSALANLPNSFWQGQEVGRENALRRDIAKLDPKSPTFMQDATALLIRSNPKVGLALESQFQNAQALANIRQFSALPDPVKTRMLYSGGDASPGPATDAPAPNSINPNGPYEPQSGPGPIEGTSTVQPSNVPAPGYTVAGVPEDVLKATGPAGAVTQANERAKLGVEREKTRPSDEAMVSNLDDRLGRLALEATSLLANDNTPFKDRGPSKGLESITGNYKIGQYDTGIPNSWLPDVSQRARNASARLDAAVIQTGLSALEQMRQASQTGASGLGQLAIEESRFLQNSITSYSKAQGPQQAAQALKAVVYWTNRVREIAHNKFRSTYGTDFKAPEQPPVPNVDTPTDSTVGPTGPQYSREQAQAMAQEALKAGKDPTAVAAMLKQMGYDLGQQ